MAAVLLLQPEVEDTTRAVYLCPHSSLTEQEVPLEEQEVTWPLSPVAVAT